MGVKSDSHPEVKMSKVHRLAQAQIAKLRML